MALCFPQEAKLQVVIKEIVAAVDTADKGGLKVETRHRHRGLKWRLQEMHLEHLEEALKPIGVPIRLPEHFFSFSSNIPPIWCDSATSSPRLIQDFNVQPLHLIGDDCLCMVARWPGVS